MMMADLDRPERGWVVPPRAAPALEVIGTSDRFPVGRIWCVGRNYAAHAREMESDRDRPVDPAPPFFFLKPVSALTPGGGEVPYPPRTGLLHHEVELVVALGHRGWNLAPERALDVVFGYGVGLDLTRRDLQAEAKIRGRPWTLAKGFDGSAPCSAIRPASQIGHPVTGRITAAVNGETRQQGDIGEQIWSVAQVVAALSSEVELLPGDLLFTGTPAGVGPLEPGDRVTAAIDGVGRLDVEISAPR